MGRKVDNEDQCRQNTSKSSKDDTDWDPELRVNETSIKPLEESKFLGVDVSNDLRFKSYVNKVVKRRVNRNKILRCLFTNSWGNRLETQRKLYIQYVRSSLVCFK